MTGLRHGWLSARSTKEQPHRAIPVMDQPRHLIPLFLLIAAAVIFYLLFMNSFAVPNTDFFAFRANASSHLSFLLPQTFHRIPLLDDFKRLPLFPILMGFLAIGMPGPDPFIRAAELLNLLLAPVSLFLVYRIARHFLGQRASFAVTALFAVNPTTLFCVTQPLLEMVLLTTVLLSVHLSLRGSQWAYLSAFFASLTRYEGVLLIPALLVYDLLSPLGRMKWQRVRLAGLALSGFVIWMGLLRPAGYSGMHPYLTEIRERPPQYGAFLTGSLDVAGKDMLPSFFDADRLQPVVASVTLGLMLFGVVAFIRQYRRASLVSLGFLAGHAVIHTIFPEFQPRYTFPVLWLLYLLMVMGAKALLGGFERLWSRVRWSERSPAWLLKLFGVFVGAAALYPAFQLAKEDPASLVVYGVFCASVLWMWKLAGRTATARQFRASYTWSLLLCLMLGFGTRASSRLMRADWVRNNCAQFRAAAEWYGQVGKPGDKMVVTLPPMIMSYYSQLPLEYFLHSKLLVSESLDPLSKELSAQHVTYVLWDSEYGRDRSSYYAKAYKAPLLTALIDSHRPKLEAVKRIRIGSKEAAIYRVRAPVASEGRL